MRLLCFLGSGVSRPSGLPMSTSITNALFEGPWHKHTDELFYPGPGGLKLHGVDVADLARSFLKKLAEAASPYLETRRLGHPTYEHLFSLAKVVEHELSDESHHPAFGDFVDRITYQTRELWESFPDPSWSLTRNDRLASLAREAQIFVESVVRVQLGIETPHTDWCCFTTARKLSATSSGPLPRGSFDIGTFRNPASVRSFQNG